MMEKDLTMDRLERSLSSLQGKLKVTTMENTNLKDRLRKVGFLQEESGRLTTALNQRTKELEAVVAERDELKNSLEVTQAQVRHSNNSSAHASHMCIYTMHRGVCLVCTSSKVLRLVEMIIIEDGGWGGAEFMLLSEGSFLKSSPQ